MSSFAPSKPQVAWCSVQSTITIFFGRQSPTKKRIEDITKKRQSKANAAQPQRSMPDQTLCIDLATSTWFYDNSCSFIFHLWDRDSCDGSVIVYFSVIVCVFESDKKGDIAYYCIITSLTTAEQHYLRKIVVCLLIVSFPVDNLYYCQQNIFEWLRIISDVLDIMCMVGWLVGLIWADNPRKSGKGESVCWEICTTRQRQMLSFNQSGVLSCYRRHHTFLWGGGFLKKGWRNWLGGIFTIQLKKSAVARE